MARIGYLGEERELLDAEGACGGEGVEREVDGGGAVRMPASALAAARPGLPLLRHQGHLAAVEELQEQQEHLVADRVHGYDCARCRGGGSRAAAARGGGGGSPGRRARAEVVQQQRAWRGGLVGGGGAAEELAEEEAARGEDAAVRVHEAALHVERDVAEGLRPVDEQVEVVHGQRLERVLHGRPPVRRLLDSGRSPCSDRSGLALSFSR